MKSLKMNKVANLIVKRINTDMFYNMKRLINRNNGIINYGKIFVIINSFLLKKISTGNIQIYVTKNDC